MRRFSTILPLAALLCCGLCVPAFASPPTPVTHYRWKDASGVVHFSDTIPASALAGGYDIVNGHGMVVRHVDRELSPTERRSAAASAARAAAVKRKLQQQRIEDAQMLAAYSSAEDLEHSQQAQLQQLQDDIATLGTNLRSQEDSLTELLAHAADLEHSDKPVPAYVNQRIADQRATVNNERAVLTQRHADFANAKRRFAQQLAHYQALRKQMQETDPSQR
ncbi:MAG TPA: DUF4124 domain-containing protein [Rhodanobacteraceae bacterium]|nr:DUF4124 domain-containing protein [Rhodanobacteraceae bacterium]